MSGGETMTAKIERLAPAGEGIARAEGSARVLFVAHAAPGDRAELEVTDAKSSFARARIRRLLSPGPGRVDPRCPHHPAPSRTGPFCGGCGWQHLDEKTQLEQKRGIVLDCLERLGKLRGVPVAATLRSPKAWGYRNKVQIPFAPGPDGPRMGFFAAGSREIVPLRECPIQPDLTVRMALWTLEAARRRRWTAYDGRTGRGWLRHLFLRADSEGQVLAALVTSRREFPDRETFAAEMRAAFPELRGLHQNVQPERSSVVLGPEWRRVWGARELEERLGRFVFAASPGAFLQVNSPAAEILYDAAKDAALDGGRRFPMALDLYCGVGTLTAWLSDAFPKLVGVEENREAVADAWRNARRNGVSNCRFVAGRAEAALPRLSPELPASCAAVVDPPRAGLSQPVRRFLTDRRLKRLVYVSCDPATFARDAQYLSHSGWTLRRVQPVDLFPQTPHVELVGLLDRSA